MGAWEDRRRVCAFRNRNNFYLVWQILSFQYFSFPFLWRKFLCFLPSPICVFLFIIFLFSWTTMLGLICFAAGYSNFNLALRLGETKWNNLVMSIYQLWCDFPPSWHLYTVQISDWEARWRGAVASWLVCSPPERFPYQLLFYHQFSVLKSCYFKVYFVSPVILKWEGFDFKLKWAIHLNELLLA